MRRHRKILVAVDGSQASLHALEEAIRLAQWGRGGVMVITVAPPYEGDLNLVGVKNIKALTRPPCEETLHKALDVAEASEFDIDLICEEGNPHEKIIERAISEQSELIVMGAQRRRHSFLKTCLGSEVARVASSSPLDLLVIPQDARVGWDRMLFALRGPDCNAKAINGAVELAVSYGGKLMTAAVVSALFSANGDSPAMRRHPRLLSARRVTETVAAAAHRAGVPHASFVRAGRVARAISSLAREHRVDMILLAPRRTSSITRFFTGRLVERVLRSVSAPLYVLNGIA